MFSFERMIAWQKAVDWADEIFELADQLPQRLQFSFGEQLRRACLSVSNNLAEGSGRRTPAGQRYFYDIAHGLTYEVISILAVLKKRHLVKAEDFAKFYKSGDELASLVFGLQQATLKAELKQPYTQRPLRESGVEYFPPYEPDPSV